ncbi:MAG TPA: NUDIX domain-containing protein [Candidatus Cybelea sp.]|nr:NUDIX domain-containing protein [Candidatus Cybelea sp.]
MIHLATGIALREEHLLLAASRYPNQPQPLWNLPGGRQQPGELLEETVAREFLEETSLRVSVRELAYVSESYDGDRHFLNATFVVDVIEGSSFGGACPERGRDHVVGVEWVALGEVRERIAVAVVREPLVAFLEGRLARRYAGYHEAGVTIEWPDGSV